MLRKGVPSQPPPNLSARRRDAGVKVRLARDCHAAHGVDLVVPAPEGRAGRQLL